MACVRTEDVWLPDKLVASNDATPSIPNESTSIETMHFDQREAGAPRAAGNVVEARPHHGQTTAGVMTLAWPVDLMSMLRPV